MNATSPLVQRRRLAGHRRQRPDDAVVMDQRARSGGRRTSRASGYRSSAMWRSAWMSGQAMTCARQDTSPMGPSSRPSAGMSRASRVGQSRPGRDLEAVVAHEPEGRGVGAERAFRLVDDHPDELRAIVRGGQPADDPQDRVERLGELRFEPAAWPHRPSPPGADPMDPARSAPTRRRRIEPGAAVTPVEDGGAPPVRVDDPSQASGSPSSPVRARTDRWSHRPGTVRRPPSVRGPGRTIVRGSRGVAVRNGQGYTPRASQPSWAAAVQSPTRGSIHPRGRRSQSQRRQSCRRHRETGPSRLLTADRDPMWSRHLRRDVPHARWHPCST